MRTLIRALALTMAAPWWLGQFAVPAHADNALIQSFDDGRWRTEFGAATGVPSGRRNRGGDFVVKGSVEYEWPIFARAT